MSYKLYNVGRAGTSRRLYDCHPPQGNNSSLYVLSANAAPALDERGRNRTCTCLMRAFTFGECCSPFLELPVRKLLTFFPTHALCLHYPCLNIRQLPRACTERRLVHQERHESSHEHLECALPATHYINECQSTVAAQCP